MLGCIPRASVAAREMGEPLPAAAAKAGRGLVSGPGADYDQQLTAACGGPVPKFFPKCFEAWPAQHESGNGKVALVTGGAAGIGFYVAKLLARCGYQVILPARPGAEAEAAEAAGAIAGAVPGAVVRVPDTPLDLASFKSVRAFAREVRGGLAGLDLLCLNAGRGGSAEDAREETEDGHEAIMQVNTVSHVLLTLELLPLLRGAPEARVVFQSSEARLDRSRRILGKARDIDGTDARAFNAFDQYRLSKVAGCFAMQALNARLRQAGDSRIRVCVADPGLAATAINFQHNLMRSMFKLPNSPMTSWGNRWAHASGQHAADGALPMVLACVTPNLHPNDWFRPGGPKGRAGLPIKGDPAGHASHVDSQVDPLNTTCSSLWPAGSQELVWTQILACIGKDLVEALACTTVDISAAPAV